MEGDAAKKKNKKTIGRKTEELQIKLLPMQLFVYIQKCLEDNLQVENFVTLNLLSYSQKSRLGNKQGGDKK